MIGRGISVSVKVYGDLRKYLRKDAPEHQTASLPRGATVGDLLRALGVPEEAEVTPGLNGELAGRESRLNDGDEVLLFSQMEGG